METLEKNPTFEKSSISVDEVLVNILLPKLQEAILSECGKNAAFYPGGGEKYLFAKKLSDLSYERKVEVMRTFVLINGYYKDTIFRGVDVKKAPNGRVSSYEFHLIFSLEEKEKVLQAIKMVKGFW